MALNANKVDFAGGGNKFAIQANLEAGNYPGRLVQVIDFGLQKQRPYQGQEKPPAHEIGLTYELVDEFMKDEDGNDLLDKPRWISEQIPLHNLKADKAKSTMRYNALDPKGDAQGDFSQLLDTPITVTVVNNKSGDKVYDNVGAITPMRPRDAANCPPLVNEAKFFDLDAPDMEVFGKLPKWIQEKIQSNLNYEGSALQKLVAGGPPPEKKEAAPPKKDRKPPVQDDPPFDPDTDNNPY